MKLRCRRSPELARAEISDVVAIDQFTRRLASAPMNIGTDTSPHLRWIPSAPVLFVPGATPIHICRHSAGAGSLTDGSLDGNSVAAFTVVAEQNN